MSYFGLGMSYFGKGKEVDLDERDKDCTHQVCDLVMISGPGPGTLIKECKVMQIIQWRFYMKEILMRLMEESSKFFLATVLAGRRGGGRGEASRAE